MAVWLWVIFSDIFHIRWQLLVLESKSVNLGIQRSKLIRKPAAIIGLIPGIIMTIWTRSPATTPIEAAYASYFLSFAVGAAAPLLLAWATDM
jgi:hypothetical protein